MQNAVPKGQGGMVAVLGSSVDAIEKILTESLLSLPGILSVRGKGAMLAAELDSQKSKEIAQTATERGLLVNPITSSALRFTPPLTTTPSEIEEAIDILKGVLNDTTLT